VISAELLADFESCQRRGYFTRDYEPRRLHPTELTRRAIYAALCDAEPDSGRRAGEEAIALCGNIGLEVKDSGNLYDCGLHHAAIADIVTSYLRGVLGPSVGVPADGKAGNHAWVSGCLAVASQTLARVALVDHFSDDRTLAEGRSWYTIGEVAVYDAPMDIYLISLGASRGGKRHSAWSKGLLHPRNRKVRFKKQAKKVEGFKDSWIPVWREEHDQISRQEWLRGMEEDGVLQDLVTTVRVEPLSTFNRQQELDTIQRKADQLQAINKLPDMSRSACDWPRPCGFRCVCFAPLQVTPEQVGFGRRHDSVVCE
jgi:hypothetical protein